MTGGTVVETKGNDGYIEIEVEDAGQKLTIRLETNEDSKSIRKGDAIWWQGRKAYWTPTSLQGYRDDIEIPRIGYSRQSK